MILLLGILASVAAALCLLLGIVLRDELRIKERWRTRALDAEAKLAALGAVPSDAPTLPGSPPVVDLDFGEGR